MDLSGQPIGAVIGHVAMRASGLVVVANVDAEVVRGYRPCYHRDIHTTPDSGSCCGERC